MSQTLLVTTASLISFPSGYKKNLLGEWCRLYTSKDDSCKVLPYHWDDRTKLYNDYKYLQNLNVDLISELAEFLNDYHSIDYPREYWELLVGYWVNLFTAVLYDRWAMIKEATNLGTFDRVCVVEYHDNDLIPTTVNHFVDLIQDDDWNLVLYSHLVSEYSSLDQKKIIVNHISGRTTFQRRGGLSIKSTIKTALSWGLGLFNKKDQLVLDRSYFGGVIDSILNMKLNHGLRYNYFFEHNISDVNGVNRDWTIGEQSYKDEFQRVARDYLKYMIPRVFLEDYKIMVKKCSSQRLPLDPKVICTGVSHFISEPFNHWVGIKRMKGSRLLTTEHGGYGVGKYNGAVEFQLKVSDDVISTGWRTDKTTPVGNFRMFNKKVAWNRKGGILQVCVAMPRYSFDIRAMVVAGQMIDYFEDQFVFVDGLEKMNQKHLTVRLYPYDYGWNQRQRWKDRYPDVSVDDGRMSMISLLKHTRIFVATYNATTYIETLSINFPTVIFWNKEHWEISDDAMLIFKRLEVVGIFHTTPQSAANHINNIFNDVQAWWRNTEVQSAVQMFCDNYAAMPDNMVDKLEDAILKEMKISEC